MADADQEHVDTRVDAKRLWLDRLCDDFERHWSATGRGQIEEVLSTVSKPDQLQEALRELLLVELELRNSSGNPPRLDEYLKRFPNHAVTVRTAFEESGRQADEMHIDQTIQQENDSNPRGSTLRIRCPHCQDLVETHRDESLSDLVCQSCGSAFSLVEEDSATKRANIQDSLGHFDLVERLGYGGFGEVWKARDTELDRTVAIKIPRRGQLRGDEAEKFLREARAAAQLKHPNIVGIHEVGRENDTLYIVSDLIRGLTLADWLTGHRPTQREVAELCSKIASALHHAHEAGVVHRDLKPGNIMLDHDLEPHVMDFGLAKRDVGEVTMTMDGQVLGTPAYMSPEQAKGEGGKADCRTDVYSLGVVLFELLTGETPFRGNVRMMIHQVINDEAPSPRRLNNNVDRDLETICSKCMEKERANRYATASEVRDELDRYLAGKPIIARPISTAAHAWRWCKRKPVLAALSLSVLGLLVGIGVISSAAYLSTKTALEKASAARIAANVEAENAKAANEATQSALIETQRQKSITEATLVRAAEQVGKFKVELGEISEAALWFASAANAAKNNPARREANQKLFDAAAKLTPIPVHVFQCEVERINGIAIGANNRFLLVHSIDGDLIRDLQTGKSVRWPESRADISSDGSFVVVGKSGGNVTLRSLPSLKITHEFDFNVPDRPAVQVSPDNRLIALGVREVRLWSVVDKKFLPQTATMTESDTEKSQVQSLVFSDDQAVLVASNSNKRVWPLSIDANGVHRLTDPLNHTATSEKHTWRIPPILTDGSIVVKADSSLLRVIDRKSGDTSWELPRRGTILNARLSDDGRSLIVSYEEAPMQFGALTSRILVFDLSTRSSQPASFFPKAIGLACRPGQSAFASYCDDGFLRCYDFKRAVPVCASVRQQEECVALAFSPDGTHCATAQSDGLIRLYRLPYREYRPLKEDNSEDGSSINDSSDGALLVTVSELLSGRRVSGGNSTPLSSAEWLARWKSIGDQVQAMYPNTLEEEISWRRDQAWQAIKDSQLNRAQLHLRYLLRSSPDDAVGMIQSSLVLARMDQIDQATRTLQNASTLDSKEIATIQPVIPEILEFESLKAAMLPRLEAWCELEGEACLPALTWLYEYSELEGRLAEIIFRRLTSSNSKQSELAARIIAKQSLRPGADEWNWRSKSLTSGQRNLIAKGNNDVLARQYQDQSRACIRAADYQGGVDALNSLLKLRPGDTSAWNQLAELHARYLHNFREAERCYGELIRIDPDSRDLWHKRIYILHYLNSREDYLAACHAAFKQFARSSDPEDRRFVAIWFTCMPEATSDWSAIRELISTQRNSAYYYGLLSRARVEVRSGNHAGFQKIAQQIINSWGGLDSPGKLFKVISLHSHDPDTARRALADIEKTDSGLRKALPTGDLGESWWDVLYKRSLYREARALVDSTQD